MNNPLVHFCNIPELQLSSEILNYPSFTTHKISEENNSTMEVPAIILGKQAEFLFEAYIDTQSHLEKIVSNIQVQDKKRTIGELDYIIRDTLLNRVFHVELACKFYLFTPASLSTYESQWIGPNLKDTLQDKITKLKEHQFPLLYTKQAIDIHKAYHLSDQIVQAFCIKAQLFIPKGIKISTFSKAYQACIAGHYIHYSKLTLDHNALYALPSKKEWLLPYSMIASLFMDATIAKTAIMDCIANKKSPLVYQRINGVLTKFFVTWW